MSKISRKRSKSPRKKTLKSSYPSIPHISRIAPNIYKFSREWAILKRNVVYEDLTILAIQQLIWHRVNRNGNIVDALFVYLGPTEDFGTSSDTIWDGLHNEHISYVTDDFKNAWDIDKEKILRYKDKISSIELIEE